MAISFSGDVVEILVYNRALVSEEREEVRAYLNNKYFGQTVQGDCNANGIPDECEPDSDVGPAEW